MRNSKEILDEVREEAHKDNCQSWPAISYKAMERAKKEFFYYIHNMAEEFDKNASPYEFMDAMDASLNFDD